MVQKTLNDLSFGLPVIVETTETTDDSRNLVATTIQAHHRGHWTRRLIQAAGMLEAVHIIQQAYYNFVLRRRVASLAPYTLSDKGPLPSVAVPPSAAVWSMPLCIGYCGFSPINYLRKNFSNKLLTHNETT